ncbi:hypothetical protein NDU88_000882 [Pleurodeles waltl]|uniref:Uncharacterized protein n=1 Tax=Pleurodeles waltl TaxID=8319 RepID=A0AAV7KUN1_PLEWA|nr:hypothetical protein NDU88_000882 [Pleurodeles waltl]
MATVSGTDETETSAPRSHVAMGTPSALLTRFPVARETLKTFRDTEEGKTKVRGQPDERVEGEKKDVQSAETVERSIEPIEEVAEGGATNDGRLELENPGASHDPGGSWLTKEGDWGLQAPVIPARRQLHRKKRRSLKAYLCFRSTGPAWAHERARLRLSWAWSLCSSPVMLNIERTISSV